MIRQQFPYLEESELYLQTVYDLAKTMTPVDEVPIMMELPPDEAMAMQLELQEPLTLSTPLPQRFSGDR